MSENSVLGIHHVTAMAGDPQQNIDFYAGILGLRMVKITVNYDDPGTYHFYYGDAQGTPGSILTFFPWPNAYAGRQGTGQATVTSYSVRPDSLGYWTERFKQNGVAFETPFTRFNEEVLPFADRDGMKLELVAHPGAEQKSGFFDSPIPEAAVLRGFHSVTLSEANRDKSLPLLTETLGFRPVAEEDDRLRLETGEGGSGRLVEVRHLPGEARGTGGTGTVHHIAWRTAGDSEEAEWKRRLHEGGYGVSPVMDRQYFHSIYFREPGGVLYEIATDPPGFTTDETVEMLGTGLKLPEWLEPNRVEIERILPVIDLPGTRKEATR